MKLKNLSKLTALLLALVMLFSTVTVSAEGLDFTDTDYNRALLEKILSLPTAQERSDTLLKYDDDSIAALMWLYYDNDSFGYMDAYPEYLCYCYTDTLYPYGSEEHAEDCSWHKNFVPSNPNNPPLYDGQPNGAQYSEDVVYNLSDLHASGRAVILKEGSRATLNSAATGGVWQVYTGSEWVNIAGETGSSIVVTDAKLNTIFELTGIAQLRYYDEANHIVLDTVEVTSQAIAGGEYAEAAALLSLQTREVDATYNDGDDSTCTVVIEYRFYDSNKTVTESWTGTFSPNQVPNQTIPFPTEQGYLPYLDPNGEVTLSLTLNTALTADVKYIVYYKPAMVNFTVKHYQQNVADDNYTLYATDTEEGLTNSAVGAGLANTYTGFYSLLYDTTVAIAADGSTVIEVYYDRYYYLMTFELPEDAYGTEPVYARYGADIGEVTNPTRPGYFFMGWSLDGTTKVDLPTTMPAENRTYKALWQTKDYAKISIVYWGENANDTEYSYIDSAEVYAKPGDSLTFTPNGNLICSLEEHQHDGTCGTYQCGIEEHTHTVENCYQLICTDESHVHSDACGLNCTHVHDISCFYAEYGSLREVTAPNVSGFSQQTLGNGVLYTKRESWDLIGLAIQRYLYLDGKWYTCFVNDTQINTLPISFSCNHTHSDACYGCGETSHEHVHTIEDCYELTCEIAEHIHSNDCGYVCGKITHTHTDDCYMNGLDSNLWTFEKSDTVTVAADGSTVINVYYKRVEKTLTFNYNYSNNNGYQSTKTIKAKWGADIASEYVAIANDAGSTFWSAKTGGGGPYTNYFGVMPQTSATYYNRGASGNSGTMTYYGQDLSGQYTVQLFAVPNVGGYTVTDEDRYEFEGFTYSHGTSNGSSCSGATFYYTRNSYTLVFNDGYTDVKTETVLYEAPLSTYSNFIPTAPDAYEPGSVTFGGWYLNPECTGEEYKLNEHTMPAENVLLYAKWVPVNRTVEFYLDKAALDTGTKIGATHPDITVPHGTKYDGTVATPTNGSYTFVGWFYMDGDTEKAFDFANMPVTKNMKVYGKWSSNVLKTYTIKYVLKDTDTEIAEATTGSALAGTTKTFYPKGDTDLYATPVNYQEGYFPTVQSHSVTIAIDGTNEFEFEYVKLDKVPYKVYYISKTAPSADAKSITYDGETYYLVADTKRVLDNKKAVVTENYKSVVGYLPDDFQKNLVVYADGTDTDNDGVAEENTIYFIYEVNVNSNDYKVIHYIENPAGTHEYEGKKWSIYQEETKPGINGRTYTERPISIPNYVHEELYGEDSGVLSAETDLELTFYYTEEEVTIEYVAALQNANGKPTTYSTVGGTVNLRGETDTAGASDEETVSVVTGSAKGAIAIPNTNYKFVGWYSDAECTNQVATTTEYVPSKVNGLHVEATYYALFAVDKAELTIKKTGMASGESAIFEVQGPGYDGLVVVPNGDTGVTLYVTCGDYTIAEVGDWTWRYELDTVTGGTLVDGEITATLDANGTTVEIANTSTTDQWLSDEGSVTNTFAPN